MKRFKNRRQRLLATKRAWPRIKKLFWSSILIVMLLMGLLIVLIWTTPNLYDLKNLLSQALDKWSLNRQIDSQETKSKSTSKNQSFAFLGRVDRTETKEPSESKAKLSGNSNSRPNTNKHRLYKSKKRPDVSGKNYKDIKGDIPDLRIDFAGHDVEEIAQRYGYLLVAATQEKVLGKIVNQRFSSISLAELNRYSKRGRSADALHKQWAIRQSVARNLNIPISDIQLLFLVPLSVEQKFVDVELRAITQAGLNLQDVKLVEAFYDQEFGVKVQRIITKNFESFDVN